MSSLAEDFIDLHLCSRPLPFSDSFRWKLKKENYFQSNRSGSKSGLLLPGKSMSEESGEEGKVVYNCLTGHLRN